MRGASLRGPTTGVWRGCAFALPLTVLSVGIVACTSDPAPGPPPTSTGKPPVEPVCSDGTRWQEGTTAFRVATADWGLDQLGVEGQRLTAVDFDGDGWVDLSVRRGGSEADDFSASGMRNSWLLRNTGDGRFEDVTESSGFRQTRAGDDPAQGRPGELVVFADVDNDGDLDAYTGLTEWLHDPQDETSELLLNRGDGTFELGPADGVIRITTGDMPAGAAFVDYDRDGYVDLWITQNSDAEQRIQDRLYRGDGTARFDDVTDQAGLTTEFWTDVAVVNEARGHSWAWSAAACDLNGDGNADLLAASFGRAPNHLWQATGPNEGSGFLNRSLASGYAFDDRTTWTDNELFRCHCMFNSQRPSCAGVPPPQIQCQTPDDDAWSPSWDEELARLGGNSATTVCADVDNDGDLDLLTTEIQMWWAGASSDPSELLLNDGRLEVSFERPGNDATGLLREDPNPYTSRGDMTAAVFDFDNDGWPDIYIGASDYADNRGLLYHQSDARQFEAVPSDQGIDHNRSDGVAVADFDRDGDLDLVVGHSRHRCDGAVDCYPTEQVRLFENTLGHDGNWVQLTLLGGEGTNRAAIGARVALTGEDGVTQTREVGGGYGHFGIQHDLTLHFGLGEACRAQVTVRWPDAELSEQSFEVVSGYRFVVEQGQQPEPVLPDE